MVQNSFGRFARERGAYPEYLGALLVVWQLAAGSLAGEFAAGTSEAEWHLTTSALECRLSQPIPYFGEGVFRQRAGEPVQFRLSTSQRVWGGESRLLVQAPPWREPIEPVVLGPVVVRGGAVPVELGEALAEKMLAALFEGLSPVFDRFPSPALGGESSVALVAVNFRRAYSDYRDCLAGLPALAYQDIVRSRILFASGADELDDAARAHLDIVARHVGQKPELKTIYVDGYTDDTGSNRTNMALSQRRAESVANYLLGKGVAARLITTRHHGSRYPVAAGRSVEARAQNRRVTVRLE
jgi:outer membrane protein OmpA-like peptidoglycan-associated protein